MGPSTDTYPFVLYSDWFLFIWLVHTKRISTSTKKKQKEKKLVRTYSIRITWCAFSVYASAQLLNSICIVLLMRNLTCSFEWMPRDDEPPPLITFFWRMEASCFMFSIGLLSFYFVVYCKTLCKWENLIKQIKTHSWTWCWDRLFLSSPFKIV